MRQATRCWNVRNRTDLSLDDISRKYNPILRGWVEYYGKFHPSAMDPVWGHFNKTLVAWAMQKYLQLRGHKTRAGRFVEGVAKRQPGLFIHWQQGKLSVFA